MTARTRLRCLLPAAACALAALASSPAAAAVSAANDSAKPVVVATPAPPSHVTGTTTSRGHLHGLAVTPNVAHNCIPLTNPLDKVREGVFCADMLVTGTNTVTPQAQAICQNQAAGTGGIAQCANISLSYTMWMAGQIAPVESYYYPCGHTHGPCPPGPAVQDGLPFWWPDGCAEVWTTVDQGSFIDLPGSGKRVTLTGNLGSGHVFVGPAC
jgi:hypothetical protein